MSAIRLWDYGLMTDNGRIIDLHTHTLKSDGSMTPPQLINHAAECGLSAIAVTDHDTVEGYAEAEAESKKVGIELVPAAELSAVSEHETHILGYYIDPYNKRFNEQLREANFVRTLRQKDTCGKLRELGFDVTMEEAWELAGSGILCRAHFAQLLYNKGYVESQKEAFTLYLDSGKPAYSSGQYLNDYECISLIHEAGGAAFCAHLHKTGYEGSGLKAFIKKLKENGLDGIEGYYTEYTPDMHDEYIKLAFELKLMVSGGTDFHGSFKPQIKLGKGYGDLRIPYRLLEDIKKYLR